MGTIQMYHIKWENMVIWQFVVLAQEYGVLYKFTCERNCESQQNVASFWLQYNILELPQSALTSDTVMVILLVFFPSESDKGCNEVVED